jgi:pimeloyl-ACP methyl ester carboxylesterase
LAAATLVGIALGAGGLNGYTSLVNAETGNHRIVPIQLRKAHMATEKSFDTGKVKINYLETGPSAGAPLVMFHGGAWCWQEYLSLIPSISANWHVYALDLRGNGKSGWVANQYTLEDFTGDGVIFLRTLNTPAVLVGHSIGGVVALMVAARHPEKTKAVIIEDSPLTIDNYRNIIASSREMFNTWLKLKSSARSEEELSWALAREYRDYPGVTSQWIMFFARCLWQLDPTYFDPLLYNFEGFIRGYDYQEIVKRIQCPILFLRGETKLGAVMTDGEITWLKNNFRNVTFVEISGVGHLLHLQDQGQIPALPAAAGRPAYAGGEQIHHAQTTDGAPRLSRRKRLQGPPLSGPALVAFQEFPPGRHVRRRGRARLSLPAYPGRERLHLRQPYEGRPLHHPHPGALGQGGGPARPGAHGGPRYEGRPLRIHARQDRHRRPERPVPHPAPLSPSSIRSPRPSSSTSLATTW